jgi:hypothetical protein
MSGDKSDIDEFTNLFLLPDNSRKGTSSIYEYINCKGFLEKSRLSKQREVVDYIKQYISENKVIGVDGYVEEGNIRFDTRWTPNMTPLLCLSNLFPRVNFHLVYYFDDDPLDGHIEFQNGHLLTDLCLSKKEEKGWNLHIYKTKFKYVDDMKRHYGWNRLRNVTVVNDKHPTGFNN